ncbi:hypothetical protein PONTUS_189 [Vibrio phage Pontus]|uniref:Uncharacterized protein n=1 Tax=Vibrio phage Pontus TaxID=2590874 RepID=A0A4Y6E8J0_9CAUD|nr:hypothetical protein KNU59_gp114 [Vibrio phage Pontus]QDF14814.1 hypothetical protein PONTUS_189 [Vibrio phage Pontus]
MKMKCHDCEAVFDAAEYCPECGSNGCHETIEEPKTAIFAEMQALHGQMLCLAGDYIEALTNQDIPLKQRWQAYVNAPDFVHKHDKYVFNGYDAFCQKVWGKTMMDKFYYGQRYQQFHCVESILDSLIYYIEDELGVDEKDVEDHELLVEFRELVLKCRVETCVWDW